MTIATKLIRWVLSIFFLIVSFSYLKTHFLSFVILFSLSLLLIPEVWNIVQRQILRKEVSKVFYFLFLFILFLAGITLSPSTTSKKQNGSDTKPTLNPVSSSPTLLLKPTLTITETEDKPITSLVPEYEVVRENDESGVYTAVIYSTDTSDYLIPNIIADIKSKKQKDKMSLMVFPSVDKSEVEDAFEKDDDTSLSIIGNKIRAEYKKDTSEELYYYPEGINGEKLRLEVS